MLAGVMFTSQEAAKLQGEIYTRLENRYGFASEIITGSDKNESNSVRIHPLKNGYFYEAGFRDGDQLPGYSKYKFYSLLHAKRGSSISIDVVDKNGTTKFIVVNLPN